MKIFSTAFFIAALLFASVNEVSACACCAEPGTYSIWTGKPDGYYLEVLRDIKFAPNAYLFTTEAGFDAIKGLDGIRKSYESDSWTASPEFFSLSNTFSAKTWKFNFKTKDGKAGTLTLPMPARMLAYKVDIHDGGTSGGGGPLLYKEFRFKGSAQSGTGFFQSGIVKPTTYFLVLKGRGNGCDNPQDFTHWYLEIKGKKAEYSFFGKLSSADPEYVFDEEETENQQSSSGAEVTALLSGIEQRLADAWVKGDRKFIEQVLADDWSVTDASGRILKKAEVLEEAFDSKDRQISSLKIDEISVRSFENWAVVTGRTKASGKYRGEAMEVTLRFTDVFELQNGNWQIVASQATLINQ